MNEVSTHRNWLPQMTPLAANLRGVIRMLRNLPRRRARVDYVLFDLPTAIPPLPSPRNWLLQRTGLVGEPPISLWELQRAFERIAADPRAKGVILRISGLAMPLADIQTLRGSIAWLRTAGKRVVVYGQTLDTAAYYASSAADSILLQPGGELLTLGLRQQAYFLKESLDTIGVALDVIAISPYKGAYDGLSRAGSSPEGSAQNDWLLDSRFHMIVRGIAEGRDIDETAVNTLIDTSPHLEADALAQGYIDGVMYEEDLPEWLGADVIRAWNGAKKVLLLPKPRYASGGKAVAILPIAGLMFPGKSAQPPDILPVNVPFVGEARAGDLTVVAAARALLADDKVGAVVLFIDSGGGAVTAAEAMTAALRELAAAKPMVVYMNGVAASGGYEVATAGAWIIAQPGTITGSIGVILAKPVLGGLRRRLRIHSENKTRGANAMLFNEDTPFDEEERAQMHRLVEQSYRQFIEKVATSRNMTVEAVDVVGGGRVWTGEQALKHGLIDALGDLDSAIVQARMRASLPHNARVIMADAPDEWQPPKHTLDALNPAAALRYWHANARLITSGQRLALLPVRWK